MLGTIVNATTIIIGGAFGALVRQNVKEKYRKILFDALGLACLPLGINATVSNMSKSEVPVLFIVSLAIGALIGTRIDFAGRIERYQKRKEKKDYNDPELLEGLTMASMLRFNRKRIRHEVHVIIDKKYKEDTPIYQLSEF